jgi:hypothetical protein
MTKVRKRFVRPLPAAAAARRVGRVLAAAAALQTPCAFSQETTTAAGVPAHPTAALDQEASPEGDVLSAQRLLQLMYRVRTAPGANLDGNPVTTTTDTWKLRGDFTLPLSSQWSLVLRGDLPYLAKDKYTDSNPDGNFLYGLGDMDVQAALIDTIDGRWKAGGGVRLIAPTGDPLLSSGLWRIMPIAAVRYALPEVGAGSYFEPLIRYDVSFAGDPTKKFISNLQFAPMLNVSLPNRWYVTLYPSPEIRWNFGAPITGETGRLFLPFDVRIGHKFSDVFNVSLEVAVPIVKQYPVYNFMTALRLNLNF